MGMHVGSNIQCVLSQNPGNSLVVSIGADIGIGDGIHRLLTL